MNRLSVHREPRTGRRPSVRGASALTVLASTLLLAAPGAAGDWPMWGGHAERNMVSPERGLPASWDVERKEDVKWTALLGKQTFGNPVIADGRIYIGTNNGRPRDPQVKGDKGILMCFATADGKFLWQAVHDKLSTGNAEDWPEIGVCSTPCVAGGKVYYVSNRCELVCLDAEGFTDKENDGPLQGEARHGAHDADFIWLLDMRGKLGVSPYNASASSPVVDGNLVFVLTGQGIDQKTEKVKNPSAPSFLAVRKNSGEVVWKDSSPGSRIVAGQWASPACGTVGGKRQAAFPGGDGWLYAFEAATGKPLWKFNCNAHEKGGKRASGSSSNHIIATPVYHENRVFIAVGQDPEAGDGDGCLRAIDATRRGDVTASAEIWRIDGEEFGRSISTVAIDGDLVYAAELGGYLDCIELATGKRVWRHDLLATIWSSPLVADGKIYLPNEDGIVVVFQTGRTAKVLAENEFPGSLRGSVLASDGVLYVADQGRLYAIRKP